MFYNDQVLGSRFDTRCDRLACLMADTLVSASSNDTSFQLPSIVHLSLLLSKRVCVYPSAWGAALNARESETLYLSKAFSFCKFSLGKRA